MGQPHTDVIEVLYSPAGQPVNCRIRGNLIYSSVDPHRQVDTWYEKEVRDISENFLVVFGFGLGLQLKRLLEEKSEERMIYLIVEDGENFASLHPASGLNLKKLNGIYTISEVPKLLHMLPGSIGTLARTGIRVIGFPSIIKALENEYTEFLKNLNDILQMIKVNFNTTTFLGPQMEINEAVNIVRTLKCPGIKNWKGILGDFPVVVVGAGPSLKKNIEVLLENKDRVFIIAVGRVVKMLEKHGIKPDVVCIIDPNVLQYDYLAGTDLRDVFIVADHKTSYLVFEKIEAKFVAFDRLDPVTKWLRGFTEDKGYLSDFFNVSHMGVLLAYHLTSGPVAIMGVDLAFTDTTHAEGVILNQQVDMKSRQDTIWIEGNVEEKVSTLPNMYSMIRFLEMAIAGVRPIFNATEGGARIKGAEPVKLRDFMDSNGREEKVNLSDKLHEQYQITPYSKEEYEKTRSKFKEQLDNLIDIQKKYKIGMGKVEKLKKYSTNINKNAEKINRVLSQIDSLHTGLYSEIDKKKADIIINFSGQAEILLRTRREKAIEYKKSNNNQMILEEEIKRFGSYFESMVFNVEYAAQMIVNMIAVLDEENPAGKKDNITGSNEGKVWVQEQS